MMSVISGHDFDMLRLRHINTNHVYLALKKTKENLTGIQDPNRQ